MFLYGVGNGLGSWTCLSLLSFLHVMNKLLSLLLLFVWPRYFLAKTHASGKFSCNVVTTLL